MDIFEETCLFDKNNSTITSDHDRSQTESETDDLQALRVKVEKLREDADFWRRSEQVSRHCLRALLQEKLGPHSGDFDEDSAGRDALKKQNNQEDAMNEDALECLNRLDENETLNRKIVALCNEAKFLRRIRNKILGSPKQADTSNAVQNETEDLAPQPRAEDARRQPQGDGNDGPANTDGLSPDLLEQGSRIREAACQADLTSDLSNFFAEQGGSSLQSPIKRPTDRTAKDPTAIDQDETNHLTRRQQSPQNAQSLLLNGGRRSIELLDVNGWDNTNFKLVDPNDCPPLIATSCQTPVVEPLRTGPRSTVDDTEHAVTPSSYLAISSAMSALRLPTATPGSQHFPAPVRRSTSTFSFPTGNLNSSSAAQGPSASHDQASAVRLPVNIRGSSSSVVSLSISRRMELLSRLQRLEDAARLKFPHLFVAAAAMPPFGVTGIPGEQSPADSESQARGLGHGRELNLDGNANCFASDFESVTPAPRCSSSVPLAAQPPPATGISGSEPERGHWYDAHDDWHSGHHDEGFGEPRITAQVGTGFTDLTGVNFNLTAPAFARARSGPGWVAVPLDPTGVHPSHDDNALAIAQAASAQAASARAAAWNFKRETACERATPSRSELLQRVRELEIAVARVSREQC